MSKFITYEHDTGEIVWVDRAAITSFHPRYVNRRYNIHVTVGESSFMVHKADTIDEAKSWVMTQIQLIEESRAVSTSSKKAA